MFFKSDDEVHSLASAFYGEFMPLAKWDKTTQLAVTLFYAVHMPHRLAFDLLRSRISGLWAGHLDDECRTDLENSINIWLERARRFAKAYQNIDEISALTNIFIANNWERDNPYPRYQAEEFLEVDTSRMRREDIELYDTIEIPGMPSPSFA